MDPWWGIINGKYGQDEIRPCLTNSVAEPMKGAILHMNLSFKKSEPAQRQKTHCFE